MSNESQSDRKSIIAQDARAQALHREGQLTFMLSRGEESRING